MCCVNGISAVSDDIVNDTVSEIDSGDESISVDNDELGLRWMILHQLLKKIMYKK